MIGWFGRRGIYYGWVIVAVTFVTLFISTGFRFAFGVYYSAILDETGWGRAETAGVVSAAMIVYACTAALSGYLFDRVGARVLFPIGALCMGAGLMLCSTATSLAGLTAVLRHPARVQLRGARIHSAHGHRAALVRPPAGARLGVIPGRQRPRLPRSREP